MSHQPTPVDAFSDEWILTVTVKSEEAEEAIFRLQELINQYGIETVVNKLIEA